MCPPPCMQAPPTAPLPPQVGVSDFFGFMRNHYEGTALDDRQDVSVP